MAETFLTADPDPYGNLGAIADASWMGLWMTFSLEEQDHYCAGVARWGPLGMQQMEALIQGLLPPPSTWLGTNTCLTDHAPMVDRLRQDVARGVLANAPTPNEFAAWCDQMGAALPEPLVSALQEAPLAASTVNVAPQSRTVIKVPPWAPLPIQGSSPGAKAKRVGRPKTAEPRYETLVNDGIQIMMDAARTGRAMKLEDVARTLQRTVSGEGMSVSHIRRRIVGKLPIAQAKAIAARYGRMLKVRNLK